MRGCMDDDTKFLKKTKLFSQNREVIFLLGIAFL